MKKRLVWLLLSMTSLAAATAQSRNPKVVAYIEQYEALAVSEMIRTGVPASITLAQAVLESGCGQSELASKSNNHFGIKCKSEWTGQKTYHDDDLRGECFRVYATVADSYKDHSDFLKNRPYYQELFLLNPTDYKGWAYGLKKAGYATEKNYPESLIKLIETYNLESYTNLALNRQRNLESENSRIAQATPAPPKEPQNSLPEPSHVPTMRVAQTMVKPPSFPVAPFRINNTKVVYAPKGASLMALAAKNKLDFHKLLSLNDLGPTAVLSSGQLIYLEKRPKKGSQSYVLSAYGQTLEEIASKQGVQLKSLVSYNKLAASTPLKAGQKVYLRARAPEPLQTLLK